MTIVKAILAVIIMIFSAGYGVCGEGHFQPSNGKTMEQTLREGKAEHNAKVSEMRAKLPLLKKQLAEEKRSVKREDIVDSLGRTEDAQAVAPLLEVLQNPNESLRVRQVSVEALYRLYRPGLASSKSLSISDKQKILAPMKAVYSREQGELKCSLASQLYQMGEKKSVRSGIMECLKAGRWESLHAFYYGRVVDGVMINTALPGEDNSSKVDEAAHELLVEASKAGYPEEIRVKAADMLIKLGDKDAALKAVKDVAKNGKTYQYRALHLMPKIGNEEAKASLEEARNDPKLKASVESILRWEWGK